MSFVKKAVLSASPSHTSDYVLMIIDGGNGNLLSFWRPGDLVWTSVGDPYSNSLRDVVYYNGHFYALDSSGTIRVCDVDSPKTAERHILACVEDCEGHTREMEWWHPYGSELYILVSLGSLFVVMQCAVASRDAKGDGDTYGTINFMVFHADLAAGRLRETRDLGDRAFFLGANTSLSVQASQFPGIKLNHIYFTYNFWHTYITKFKEGGGLYMGVFHLADGSIQPHYEGVSLNRVCPPTWITPTLC